MSTPFHRRSRMNRRVTPSARRMFAVVACLSLFTLTAFAAEKKGLYADEAKDKTSGDIKDRDYWQSKWDAKMLEDAIKTRQPEGPISVNVESSLRNLEALEKKYPKHEDIKKWQARFEEIKGKLD